MKNLESVLSANISEVESYFLKTLGDIAGKRANAIRSKKKDYAVADDLGYYAALEFSDKGNFSYAFSPEAVFDQAALGEEVGHYFSLFLRPKERMNLLSSKAGTDAYVKAAALEEYIGRYFALIWLNHNGIKEYNRLWSEIRDNKIILHNVEHSDAKAHYMGYVQAERDFLEKGIQGLKDALLGKSVPDFAGIEVPRIEVR